MFMNMLRLASPTYSIYRVRSPHEYAMLCIEHYFECSIVGLVLRQETLLASF